MWLCTEKKFTQENKSSPESTWRAVGMVDRHGQQKCTICDARVPCLNELKHTEASFSVTSTDSSCLPITQMPRSRDVVFLRCNVLAISVNEVPCACTLGWH